MGTLDVEVKPDSCRHSGYTIPNQRQLDYPVTLSNGGHIGARHGTTSLRVEMTQRKILALGIALAGWLAAAWMPSSSAADDAKNANAPAGVAPPVAKKVHTENHINGGNLVDDYHWLREKSNPEVAQYLEAENAYTDAVMKPTEALQKKLYEEMLSHIKETDVNVPYKEGDYFYYSRWEAGKQYQIYGRKKGSLEAAE